MERRRYLRGLVATGVVSVAGCTSDDSENGSGNGDSGSDDTDTPTATEGGMDTPTETEADMDTDTPTETEAASTETPPPDPDQRVAVGANGLNFEPDSFEISVGDTVLWEWVDGGHSVAPESQPDGADWPGEAEEFSYSEGHTHSYTFEVAGEYEYYCQPHQSSGMVGGFTVTG